MNVSSDTPTWLWLAAVLAAVLLAVGAYLARVGFAGGRRGDEPHCARCDYIVGGLEQSRCPECGADLSARGAVVLGERVRRRGRGAIGVLLGLFGLALGLATTMPAVQRVDWYQYRPGAWVIRDFKSNDPARSDRAWAELTRRGMTDAQRSAVADIVLDRYAADPLTIASAHMLTITADRGRLTPAQRERLFAGLLAGIQMRHIGAARGARDVLDPMVAAGELGEAQLGRLTELALAEQAAETPQSPEARWLLNFLGDRELAGALTPEQRERFFTQAYFAQGDLTIRKTVVVGDMVPYSCKVGGRGPQGDADGSSPPKVWWVECRMERQLIDGKVHGSIGGSMSGTSFGSGSIGSYVVGVVEPGKHRLELVVRLAIYHVPQTTGITRDAKPRWSREVTATGDFEVVAEGPPEMWTDDPSLAEAIKAAIKPTSVTRGSPRDEDLSMNWSLSALPIDVAFDVIARINGKEYPIGTLARPKGSTLGSGMGTVDLPVFGDDDRFDLVLRSSDKALRLTTDMYHAWRGEIVYEDVKVETQSR